jgi:hemolysin III
MMRKIDQSMIFVLIAGTYTPFCVLGLGKPMSVVVLALVWGGGLLGICTQMFWPYPPKWVTAVTYLAVGWVGIAGVPELAQNIGLGGLALGAVGGLLYTMGALVYALRWPNPWPRVFGFHEVFHAFVIVAATVHFVAIAVYVLDANTVT